MKKFAISSAVEAAYWFLQYADLKNVTIEDEKLHHLLVLAEAEYMRQNPNLILFPAMFVVSEKGFFEPNLLQIFAKGHPFMSPIKLNEKTSAFLEKIWQDYANKPLLDIRSLIVKSPAHKKCFANKQVVAADLPELTTLLKEEKTLPFSGNKIRISQNGPVVVSPWKPKKVKNEVE